MFVPGPSPVKFKEVKAKRQKVKSRAEAERVRKSKRAARKVTREARLERRADKREEEKQRRAEKGEPEVTKTRTKRDPKSHHGTESVDITILKLLGKSQKSKKVAGKGKASGVEKKKVETQKWKPGMREEPREGWQEERKLKQEAEKQKQKKKLGVGVVLEDLGSDHEADLHWDPHEAAGSCSQETLPDSPPTPNVFSDVPSSSTIPMHSPLEPMPPCMEFYQVRIKQVTVLLNQIHCYFTVSFFTVVECTPVQVHADHLCTPEAHLGVWPVPPPNSIFVPPFFSPCQVAKLLASRQKPPADSSGDLTDSLTSDSGSDEAQENAVRRTVKRKKKQARKVPEQTDSSDDEAEVGRGDQGQKTRARPRREPPSLTDVSADEEARNLTHEKIPKSRRDPPNLTDNSADEEGVSSGDQGPKKRKPALASENTPHLTQEKILIKSHEETCLDHLLLRKYWYNKMVQANKKTRARPTREPPSLTDDSADEEGNLTQEKILNLAEEEVPHLTHEKIPRSRREPPNLTDESADEEGVFKGGPVPKTMRGGGAGGSNYYVWLQLAERIMEGVRRAQLPLRLPLDDITEGDGNCYFRAVCSQLQRPDVAASDQLRRLDHRSLRRKVCSFMLKSRLPVVQNFKRNWYEFRLGDYDQWWTDMAESKGNIWAEGPVIHATAWFLERDIYVVSEHASMDDPFIPFSGNQDGSDIACTGAALWLGHLTGLHYQTLMPLPKKSELMRPRPKLREVEETLQAKVQDTASGGDQQTSRPGPSKNSRVGEVSLIHFLWKLSSKC